jgi:hypothetical protein
MKFKAPNFLTLKAFCSLAAAGCLILFCAAGLQTKAQYPAWDASEAFGGEYKFPDSVCLTDDKRAEIQIELQKSIARLKAEGKLSEPSPMFLPPMFTFPVRGNGAAANDYGIYGISNFVDQNLSFPNQLLDYNCGARTYDQSNGYNHKGVDIFTWPFGWNKMDNDEAAITAAAPGTIIFKSDGNFDRSCGLNGGTWNAVYVQHADGTISWYGHMKNGSLTSKPVGATVEQGEFLGIVGSSGNSTGPHLHFEIYNSANQLQDPYQGPCNTMNQTTYWLDQPPYRDSKINKLMTHSAPPEFTSCPNPEIENRKNVFQPGEQLLVAAYYQDQVAGHQTQYSLVQPNGVVASTWSHTSPNTYNASYWFWTINIPAGVPHGVWKFRAVYQSQTYEQQFIIGSANRPAFDFDGDAKTDISIYRPSAGEWWHRRSSDGSIPAVQFGTATDRISPADFTGDGLTDIAFWRESTGEWFVLRSEDFSFYAFPFGSGGDVPAPGDFDGDGKADAAVFRSASATWYILRSSDGEITIQQFGASEDQPVVADYDGDGKDDIAVFRPSAAEWWILQSANGLKALQFGATGDRTVQGDWTGDGRADIAVWRPSNGTWYILRSEDDSYYAFPFGADGDAPVPGDYDGDGRTDAAVFRPSNAVWYLQQTTSGFETVPFGASADQPVPGAYVRN